MHEVQQLSQNTEAINTNKNLIKQAIMRDDSSYKYSGTNYVNTWKY